MGEASRGSLAVLRRVEPPLSRPRAFCGCFILQADYVRDAEMPQIPFH
jgi:hypothetical protein